jgi:hypothetical protein
MNRRKFLALGSASMVVGIAGCSSNNDAKLRELSLDMMNETGSNQTVHFMLESEDKISKWYKFDVGVGNKENFVIELEERHLWDKYHIISGEHQSRGSLLGQADKRNCITLNFRINTDGITGNFVTDDTVCTEESTEE